MIDIFCHKNLLNNILNFNLFLNFSWSSVISTYYRLILWWSEWFQTETEEKNLENFSVFQTFKIPTFYAC